MPLAVGALARAAEDPWKGTARGDFEYRLLNFVIYLYAAAARRPLDPPRGEFRLRRAAAASAS